ncbi:MAG: CBS domain-containing protein [Bacteroidetes bacterium]|nr:MAG: CBS domain-containing protein [Bacteroidota bacterium]
MQATTPVYTIMTKRPETVKPSDTMEEVRAIFERYGFHHIPVVENEKLVGLVSYTDYLRLVRSIYENNQENQINEKTLHATLVKDVMTKNLLCLTKDDSAETALRIFKTNQFHSLPVIDDNHHLVGIITTYDLMKVLEKIFVSRTNGVDNPG